MYSLKFKSVEYLPQCSKFKAPPNIILLNIYIVKAAENTIEDEDNAPAKGNLSNTPYKDINSPTKLNVSGAPQLPKHRMKNNTDNKGMA
jgi:hypothetical protein